MAQITTNQHSYSNSAALLNVEATATRTGASTVSITAKWDIYTAASALPSATRYLVLFVGSASGAKYYSTAIGTAWSSQKTYQGTHTFTGIPLAADKTEITIGFGVSGSNTAISTSGTLIWNGDAEVSSSTYDPDIQFNKITGIAKGITACTAPTSFTASPDVFEDTVTLTWSGAKGGTNNAITGYETQYSTSMDGGGWSAWANRGIETSSPATSAPGHKRGRYTKYRIRTIGAAGSAYYSGWKESNAVKKAEPRAYIHNGTKAVPHGVDIHNGAEYVRHYPYKYDGEKWVPCSE